MEANLVASVRVIDLAGGIVASTVKNGPGQVTAEGRGQGYPDVGKRVGPSLRHACARRDAEIIWRGCHYARKGLRDITAVDREKCFPDNVLADTPTDACDNLDLISVEGWSYRPAAGNGECSPRARLILRCSIKNRSHQGRRGRPQAERGSAVLIQAGL